MDTCKGRDGYCDWLSLLATYLAAQAAWLPGELRWFKDWFKVQWPGVIMWRPFEMPFGCIKCCIKTDYYCYYYYPSTLSTLLQTSTILSMSVSGTPNSAKTWRTFSFCATLSGWLTSRTWTIISYRERKTDRAENLQCKLEIKREMYLNYTIKGTLQNCFFCLRISCWQCKHFMSSTIQKLTNF